MRDSHIIKMIEEKRVSRCSDGEMAAIKAHVEGCPECLRAYDAARISDSLVSSRASEAVEVPPFFKTRVMAAIREKRLSPELPAVMRWWQAARALLSVMCATVVVLIGLTLFNPVVGPQEQPAAMAATQSLFSPEFVVLGEGDLADDVAYDQVLGTMYDLEEDDGN
jgi:hypothetical protein